MPRFWRLFWKLSRKKQLNAVGEITDPVSEIILDTTKSWKMETISMWDIFQKISSGLSDVKRLHGYILRKSAKSSQCKIKKIQERSCWVWSEWTQWSNRIQFTRKYDRDLYQKVQDQEVGKKRAPLTSQLFFTMSPLWNCKEASLFRDVDWLVDQSNSLKLKHYDISRAHFQGTV